METLTEQPSSGPAPEPYFLARFRRQIAKLTDKELDRKPRYLLRALEQEIGPEVLPLLSAALRDENRRRGFK